MALHAVERPAPSGDLTTICRISRAAGARWRVLVETWPDAGGYRGRLVFAPDGDANLDARPGPATFWGTRREEVVAAAHDLSERRLRVLLHSLT